MADEIRERIVWLNGQTLPASAARLAADDHGFLYGLGFFETFRTNGGYPHHCDRNCRRLLEACGTAHIRVPASFLVCDATRLRHAVGLLLRENRMPDGVFRYTLTAGAPAEPADRLGYDRPGELLTVRALPPPAAPEGVALRLLSIPRDSGEWQPRPKSLNYTNALMGGHELRQRGAANDEGLFLTRDGKRVVEGVRHNVAWISNGRFCFPDPTLGAVAGTCLQWVLDMDMEVEPCRAGLDEFVQADAVMLLNAVRGITPVCVLWDAQDEFVLRAWKSHENALVAELRRKWSDALAKTAASQSHDRPLCGSPRRIFARR
jgi:4-amino-4-deoxychorismate lyase